MCKIETGVFPYLLEAVIENLHIENYLLQRIHLYIDSFYLWKL